MAEVDSDVLKRWKNLPRLDVECLEHYYALVNPEEPQIDFIKTKFSKWDDDDDKWTGFVGTIGENLKQEVSRTSNGKKDWMAEMTRLNDKESGLVRSITSDQVAFCILAEGKIVSQLIFDSDGK